MKAKEVLNILNITRPIEFFDQLLFDSETNTYKILDANSQNQLTAK